MNHKIKQFTNLERIEYRLGRIEHLLAQTQKENYWITLRDAIEYTSVGESTIRRAVHKGVLKASRTTGKLLFKISNIERWLNNE